MELLLEGLAALVVLLGLGGLWCWRRLWQLRGETPNGVCLVVTGRGGGEGLEQRVRWAAGLRQLGFLRGPVVITDCGLTPEGRELALHLILRWPETCLWPGEALVELLEEEARQTDQE